MDKAKIKDNLIVSFIIFLLISISTILTLLINSGINSIHSSSPKPLYRLFKNSNINLYIVNRSDSIFNIGNIKIDKNTFISISIDNISKYLTIDGYGKIYTKNGKKDITNLKLDRKAMVNFIDSDIYRKCEYINNNIISLNDKYDIDKFISIESKDKNHIFSQTIYFLQNIPKAKIIEIDGSMVKVSSRNIHKGLNRYNCDKKIIEESIENLLNNIFK